MVWAVGGLLWDGTLGSEEGAVGCLYASNEFDELETSLSPDSHGHDHIKSVFPTSNPLPPTSKPPTSKPPITITPRSPIQKPPHYSTMYIADHIYLLTSLTCRPRVCVKTPSVLIWILIGVVAESDMMMVMVMVVVMMMVKKQKQKKKKKKKKKMKKKQKQQKQKQKRKNNHPLPSPSSPPSPLHLSPPSLRPKNHKTKKFQKIPPPPKKGRT